RRWNIPATTTDYRKLLDRKDVDAVVIGIPNDLHREVVVAAAEAGKHVILEKPIAHTLADADAMVKACKQHKIKLGYAETICFSPKYVRAKQLVDENAIGKLYMVKQGEKHSGPHSDWFYGGGTAIIEDSWAKHGGMDDRIELYGTEGVIYCDLLHGSSMQTYSSKGYGYAVEKAGDTKGWTFTVFEEAHIYGFPHEMRHFINCILKDQTPMETGDDGRATLEIIYAAYES